MVSSVNPFFSSAYASASISTLFAALPSGDAKAAAATPAAGTPTLQQSDLASIQKAAQASAAAIQAILQAAEGNAGAGQLSVSLAVSVYAESAGEQAGEPASAAPASGQTEPAAETKARSNTPASRPAGMMSIGRFMSAKHEYDVAPQDLRNWETRLNKANEQLANATDAASVEAAEAHIERATKGLERTKSTIGEFPALFNQFNSWLNSTYSVSGNILSGDGNGNYQWGEFTVSNKSTGQFWFGHNGDGNLVEADGIIAQFLTQKLL
jgi:hypothetical protein